MAATAPSYTTNPYPTATGSSSQGPITIETAQQSGQWRTLAPSAGDGPPAPAGGINAPASQGGVSQPYGNQGTQVVAAYQKYLGRTPSAEEIGSHLGYGKAMGTQNVL
ncbi:MAG TPA: hypothetical protein VEI97_01960, partial [bacterium]|nr:hypothetical protein [bacterium]